MSQCIEVWNYLTGFYRDWASMIDIRIDLHYFTHNRCIGQVLSAGQHIAGIECNIDQKRMILVVIILFEHCEFDLQGELCSFQMRFSSYKQRLAMFTDVLRNGKMRSQSI